MCAGIIATKKRTISRRIRKVDFLFFCWEGTVWTLSFSGDLVMPLNSKSHLLTLRPRVSVMRAANPFCVKNGHVAYLNHVHVLHIVVFTDISMLFRHRLNLISHSGKCRKLAGQIGI